jgi:hypothetical protein
VKQCPDPADYATRALAIPLETSPPMVTDPPAPIVNKLKLWSKLTWNLVLKVKVPGITFRVRATGRKEG